MKLRASKLLLRILVLCVPFNQELSNQLSNMFQLSISALKTEEWRGLNFLPAVAFCLLADCRFDCEICCR
jgi:hypothetical protein